MSDYISRYANGAAVDNALDLAMSAVQPETGKGLSSNDFTNEYKQKVDDNSTAVSDIQNRTTTLEGSVNTMSGQISKDTSVLIDIVNNGPKNKLKNPHTSSTKNGVTITVNSDGSVLMNGTATADVSLILPVTLKSGHYILSGCPSGGGSGTNYRMPIRKIDGNVYVGADFGNSFSFVVEEETSYNVLIYIPNAVVCDNLLFKPMICTKAEWDISHEYVPYRPSYDELIAMIEALQT
jgi:hypothetical protein